MEAQVTVESFLRDVLGSDLPVRVMAYDGTDIGPRDAATTVTLRSNDALIRMITAPGELGVARAYIAGDIEIEGSIYDVLELRHVVPSVKFSPRQMRDLVRLVGVRNVRRMQPPPEEHRSRSGRRHSKRRDAAAISHHYDVSNEFYELVLGPSMTYSCAVFTDTGDTLARAQETKYELICRKLGLRAGMRLLDIGCGWGGMVLHAAEHHGVEAVGVSLSQNQVDYGKKRVAEAGLADVVDIRLQDYRDVRDGQFDAVSSIGMFEHVGTEMLGRYFDQIHGLLKPRGRFLNHAISRTTTPTRNSSDTSRFIERYVFPDGELHEVGTVISALHDRGLEVRHMENLREHYALTLRHWVSNLEDHWDEAVALTSEGRARVWRLYMAASAVNFEDNHLHVDQVLALRTDESGRNLLPLRPDWE
jgi:cyclopropane-fatty-acyl-phospholipid synthase